MENVLSAEDLATLKELKDNIGVYREIAQLVKNKKLLYINDPLLMEKLKKAGKLGKNT